MTKLYNVGIYTRLSIDDTNNRQKKNVRPDDDSGSIENQRLLLSKFCMISGWIETKVYTDDGYSGGNFNRPGFKQMIEDIKKGVINLVLVKDLSRLGRDYIEVGRYTEVLFPSWGCRFVSLLDDLDTDKEDNDMLHFRSLMNDYHLKDISNKIKAVTHSRARAGGFFTGKPPYGYMRSAEDKHQLLIDDYAADIIRKIYALRLDGWGLNRIAEHLNSERIPSPRDYMDQCKGKEIPRPTLWMCATLKNIVRLETYIGNMVQLRVRNVSYKDNRQIKNPPSAWVRHENTHEPIIDKETWEKVQEINRTSGNAHKGKKKPTPTLFMEKLRCMDCGGSLISHGDVRHNKNGTTKTYYSYQCYRHSVSGYTACSWHTISEIALKKIILHELNEYTQAVVLDENILLDKLKRAMSLDDTNQQNLLRQEVRRLERQLEESEHITANLYEDKVSAKISEVTFVTLMEKNEQELQKRQAQLEKAQSRLSTIQEKILSVSKWAEAVRKHIDLTDLCRADIDELIDYIEVGESDYSSGTRRQEVKIYWRFIGHIPA